MSRPRPCRFCGAEASRWYPYCTSCDSLYGVPIVAIILAVFLALGLYAMWFDPDIVERVKTAQ